MYIGEKSQMMDCNLMQDLKFQEKISGGTFGDVYKCRYEDKSYAVKKISNVSILDLETIEKQVKAMELVVSSYTLPLIRNGYNGNQKEYLLLMPLCKNGSLKAKINGKWTVDEIYNFLFQMAQGFIDINSQNIFHLDLKPDNILIKAKNQYWICDFGCAATTNNANQSVLIKMSQNRGLGTPDYASPEVVLDGNMGKYTDMWSLGIILYQIIFKKHPLKGKGKGQYAVMRQLKMNTISIEYRKIDEYQQLVEICKSMLSLTIKEGPKCRLTWKGLMQKIYKNNNILKIASIVTSLDDLITFSINISVMLTGLMYYLQLKFLLKNMVNKEKDKLIKIKQSINYDNFVNKVKMFLRCHTKQITKIVLAQDVTKYASFFIFKCFLVNIKDCQRKKLQINYEKTEAFLQTLTSNLQQHNLTSSRENLESQAILILQYMNQIPSISSYLQENQKHEWKKVRLILQKIAHHKLLHFSQRTALAQFIQRLVFL